MIKRFKSIDGFFNHKLRFENLDKISWFKKKKFQYLDLVIQSQTYRLKKKVFY